MQLHHVSLAGGNPVTGHKRILFIGFSLLLQTGLCHLKVTSLWFLETNILPVKPGKSAWEHIKLAPACQESGSRYRFDMSPQGGNRA